MTVIFTSDDEGFLRRPHIARAWFADMSLPNGRWRVHNGGGTVTINGVDWSGISDPGGGRIVQISEVEDPRFGQAAKVDITLTGTSIEFLQSVKMQGRAIEGSACDVYFAVFDPETYEIWPGGMKLLFPGLMSAPKIQWQKRSACTVTVTVESIFQSQNYSMGGKWNQADQRRRYPGDKGLDLVGVKIQEVLKGS